MVLIGTKAAHFDVFIREETGGGADAIAVLHICYLQKGNR